MMGTAVVGLLIVGLLVLLLVAIGVLVARAHRERKATGAEGMIGEVGETFTELNPKGTVWLHGEYWRARLERGAEPLAKGVQVRVVALDGTIAVVEPV